MTLSKTSFFLAADMEFFRRGNVPLRVTSGQPLFKRRSTNSWELALRAYDMQVRPSWSTLLTLAYDWKINIESQISVSISYFFTGIRCVHVNFFFKKINFIPVFFLLQSWIFFCFCFFEKKILDYFSEKNSNTDLSFFFRKKNPKEEKKK